MELENLQDLQQKKMEFRPLTKPPITHHHHYQNYVMIMLKK
jgi:hypothetical protein